MLPDFGYQAALLRLMCCRKEIALCVRSIQLSAFRKQDRRTSALRCDCSHSPARKLKLVFHCRRGTAYHHTIWQRLFWHSRSQSLDLAEWPVWLCGYLPRESIAEKRSVTTERSVSLSYERATAMVVC